VKEAYRDLAMVWHPDRFGVEDERLRKKAEEKFKKVQSGYNHLREHRRLDTDVS